MSSRSVSGDHRGGVQIAGNKRKAKEIPLASEYQELDCSETMRRPIWLCYRLMLQLMSQSLSSL